MSSFMLPIPRPAKPAAKPKEKTQAPGAAPKPPTPFGRPMNPQLQAEMSRRFGESFGDVRVHTGAQAAASAETAGAAAYTIGRQVVFGPGRFAPETSRGQNLLAHELAHVVQQRRGTAASDAMAPAGLEASARAAGVAFREGTGPVPVAGGSPPALARQTPAEAEAEEQAARQRRQRTLNMIDPKLLAALQKEGIAPKDQASPEILWLGLPPSLALQKAATDVGLPALTATREKKRPPVFKQPPPPPTGDPARDLSRSLVQAGFKPLPGTETPGPPPVTPQTLQEASQVRKILRDFFPSSNEILSVFRAADPRGFVQLQGQVDMSKVLDQLDDWEIVQLGAQGPILNAGVRKRVNENRTDFLVDRARTWGPARAQFFGIYMFDNMTDDDVRTVLGMLAADKKLHETIDTMPEVLELLAARGIDRSAFHDRGGKAIDALTGLGHLADRILGSSPLAQGNEGQRAMVEAEQLPEPFRKAVQEQDMAAFLGAFRPGNVAFGVVDNVTLGLLSGAKGVVYDTPRGIISGARELSKGNIAEGVEQLTGAAIVIVGAVLGVRAFRKSARITAMLELTPEGALFYEGLVQKIGRKGIDDVAKWTRASAEAQILVHEEGAAGIQALHAAKGDVAAASAALANARANLPTRLKALRRVEDPVLAEQSRQEDEAFAKRKLENQALIGDPERLQSDLAKARIRIERFKLMRDGDPSRGGERLPLAFKNWEQYDQFKKEFGELIKGTQVRRRPITAVARNVGSSAEFYSGNPQKDLGHYFDRLAPKKTGDVDIWLNSPELVENMMGKSPMLNEKALASGEKVIFKNQAPGGAGFENQFPQFRAFSDRWTQILGHEVDVKLRADLTPVSEIPKAPTGPIELFRSIEKPQ